MIPTLHTLTSAIDNPLTGITPSLDVFGVEFEGRIQVIIGGIWALAIAISAIAVIIGGAKWAWAAKVTHSADGVMEGAGQFKTAAVAFGVVVGVSLVLGAIIWIVQG